LKTHLLNSCRKVVKLLSSSKKVAIIYHWDCDGVASASIISKLLKSKAFFHIPKIGHYSLEAININLLRSLKPDLVLIVDYGLPAKDITNLEKTLSTKIAVIDHHVNEPIGGCFCNPVALGLSEDDYPSTSWVIRELLNVKYLDLYVALGLVGDLGKAINYHRLGEWVAKVCKEHNLSLSEIFRAAETINSCYRLIDYDCIDYARITLTEIGVEGVLSDNVLFKKLSTVKEKLEEALERVELSKDLGKVKVFTLTCEDYFTSIIGRELAYRFRNSIIVFNNFVEKLGLKYVYVRSYSYSLREVLSELKGKGLNVGGKDHVFVLTCKGECDKEISMLLNTLLKHVGV